MMNINYYRQANISQHDSWQECQFTSDTDLTPFTIKPLVSINGQPFLRQNHSTYLTGKDTCRAHHFAKMLAAAVLAGDCPNVPSAQVSDTVSVTIDTTRRSDIRRQTFTTTATPRSVLWIDTIHGPHVSAQLFRELSAHVSSGARLQLVCLDVLGSERDNFFALNRRIEALIQELTPALVVIDDIDHFMPFCGVNIATEFCRIVRDVTNHTETSFLFVGYNHLSKKASTTGNLGKYLFIDSSDVFALTTQHEVTTVRLIRSYDLSRHPDNTEFRFTIGPDNFPHEAEKAAMNSNRADDGLDTIIPDVLQPGESVTASDLTTRVTTRQRQLKKDARSQDIIDQAISLNLIKKESADSDKYVLVNTSLTLPPHPQQAPSPHRPVDVLQATGL
ncbi:MAG: hypothetical protein IJV05_10760 [Muribaculaceae bacterium]|nr:hypothetical protein [Muribaculaceae bacterium]